MRLFEFFLYLIPSVVAAEPTLVFKSQDYQAQLVELFTSQGCSSCPPAEKWLNQFVDDPSLWREVVPVAFHVDYWDNLGWPDPYASDRFSARQRGYRADGNVNSVYTPGFVLNGREWLGFYRKTELPEAQPTLADLKITYGKPRVRVEYQSKRSLLAVPVDLNVAILGVGIETKIDTGENAQRTLEQHFVVLRHKSIRSNTGIWNVELDDFASKEVGRYAISAWATHPATGHVIQATGGWLN